MCGAAGDAVVAVAVVVGGVEVVAAASEVAAAAPDPMPAVGAAAVGPVPLAGAAVGPMPAVGAAEPGPTPAVAALGLIPACRMAVDARSAGARPSQPAVATRPAGGSSRPDTPKASRPTGGLKPSTQPGGGGSGVAKRPATRPSTPPDRAGGNRPNTSVPGLADRPGGSTGKRPGGDGIAGGKIDGGKIAGGKVGSGKIGDGPGKSGRPSTGNVGDFLGMQGGVRPGPGVGDNRPGVGDNRPGVGDNRPGVGGNRPLNPDRRPSRDRPVNIGNQVNNNINVRPTWANIDNNKVNNIQGSWNNAIKNQPNFNNYLGNNPNRNNYYNGWGNNVRDNWTSYGRQNEWFNQDWWEGHNHANCGWHYNNDFYNHDWSHWWTAPTWAAASSWFTQPAAAATVLSEPIYYDYGTGGNVTYQDNSVYVGEQQVASAADFAASAAVLATVQAPTSQAEAEKAQWMPLGTFAVAAGEKNVDPSRVIQLAVDKQGVISGTLYNQQTDKAQTVQGQVDMKTQRVAFRIGDSDSVVVESGLYNLTQEQAPVLVHFGADKVENYLLVRLKQTDDEAQPKS